MKIVKWVVILFVVGLLINVLDNPVVTGYTKVIVGWAIVLLGIVGLFAIMNKN